MSNMTPTPQLDLFTAMTEATTPQPVRIETATNEFKGADGKTYTATITTEYLENGATRTRTDWAERPAAGVGIVPAAGVVSKTAPADEVAQPITDDVETVSDILNTMHGLTVQQTDPNSWSVKQGRRTKYRVFLDRSGVLHGMDRTASLTLATSTAGLLSVIVLAIEKDAKLREDFATRVVSVEEEPAQPEPMEITEALEDLRTEFLAKYAEDLADHVEAQRAEYRAQGGAMDVAAWEIHKLTGMAHVFSRCAVGVEPSKVGDVFMRSGTRNGVNQLPENCQEFGHQYMSAEEKRREIMRRLDRIGYGVGSRNAKPEKVEKMAAAAWAKRLATLEKGIERNGVELATAKVTGYSAEGGDYVLFIEDAQGNGVHARSILAGGAGTCVRLHLRFICT